MTVEKTVETIRDAGVIAVIRTQARLEFDPVIDALIRGGISCIEITLNTPGALDSIRTASAAYPRQLLGAGTVVSADEAIQAAAAGARFIVTPIMDLSIVQAAIRRDCVVVCGAMTPTEAHIAWTGGAHFVKVFPASVLGAGFLQAMQGPLPQIPLVPTGGVTAETTEEFIRAGATAVCAGGWLVSEQTIMAGDFASITNRANQLCAAVARARGAVAAG